MIDDPYICHLFEFDLTIGWYVGTMFPCKLSLSWIIIL